MIYFANPAFLLLLFIIPFMYLFRKNRNRNKNIPAIKYSSLKIIKECKTKVFNPSLLLTTLRVLCISSLILALARPQRGKTYIEHSSNGIDIYLAVDTSGSMKGLDFFVNDKRVDRLTMLKKVANKFIKKRINDRIGLVVFGTEAFTQCPLTLDHGIVLKFLDRMEIGMAGESTAIGTAIATSVKRMSNLKSKSKIIILLTDGKSMENDISSEAASELAKNFNIKIYTIGIGTNGKVPFVVDTIFGKQTRLVNLEMDEDSLRKIAKITGGRYYRATDTKELEKIYQKIDKLEKSKIKTKKFTEYKEYFSYFLLFSLFILFVEVILSNTKFQILP